MFHRFINSFHRPVRRAGAERYLLVTLLSFAASITLTRLFLELTGYPQLGGGGLHIAHVLWGGLLLFIAALLPLIWVNRWVLILNSVLSGIGIGLFIDEVGKFITQENDYFYPAAAPIIYTFFLMTVLVYFQIRRRSLRSPRTELYYALDAMEEILENDLDETERADLETRLHYVIEEEKNPDLVRLAQTLLDNVVRKDLTIVPAPPKMLQKLQDRVTAFEQKYLSKTRLQAGISAAIAVIGVTAIANLARLLLVSFGPTPFLEAVANLIAESLGATSSTVTFFLVRVLLEGTAGLTLLVGAVLLASGREREGYWASYSALLVELTTIDILVFYFEQFSTILLAMIQLVVLFTLLYYKQKYINPKQSDQIHAEGVEALKLDKKT